MQCDKTPNVYSVSKLISTLSLLPPDAIVLISDEQYGGDWRPVSVVEHSTGFVTTAARDLSNHQQTLDVIIDGNEMTSDEQIAELKLDGWSVLTDKVPIVSLHGDHEQASVVSWEAALRRSGIIV